MIIAKAMNIDLYDHWSYWFMHECAVHAMKGYWSCMKTVDHSYEQALIMYDNVHIHVIMNIIVTPRGWEGESCGPQGLWTAQTNQEIVDFFFQGQGQGGGG